MICINGQHYTLRGTLSLVPGDNLASQYLGGYKALNSALRKCRQCLAVQDTMESKVCNLMFMQQGNIPLLPIRPL